jgi:hypothetical protein
MLHESKDGKYQTMGPMGVLLTLQNRSCVQVQVLIQTQVVSNRRGYLLGIEQLIFCQGP